MLIIPALACWLVLLFRLLLLRLPLPLAIFVWINAYLSTYLQHLPCTYETDPSPSPSPGQGPDSETEAQCQRQSPLRFSCPSPSLSLQANVLHFPLRFSISTALAVVFVVVTICFMPSAFCFMLFVPLRCKLLVFTFISHFFHLPTKR